MDAGGRRTIPPQPAEPSFQRLSAWLDKYLRQHYPHLVGRLRRALSRVLRDFAFTGQQRGYPLQYEDIQTKYAMPPFDILWQEVMAKIPTPLVQYFHPDVIDTSSDSKEELQDAEFIVKK